MTFTSDERREVAENLRNLTIGHYIRYKEQFFDELAEVVVGFERPEHCPKCGAAIVDA